MMSGEDKCRNGHNENKNIKRPLNHHKGSLTQACLNTLVMKREPL